MQGSILNGIYRVESQLSKRGSRSTWLAKNLNTNEAVVIKILKFGLDAEWSDFRLFEREAQTLKNIDHPAIPNYLDYFELDLLNCKGYALVQEYIAASSLEEAIKTGRTFTELEIREIADSLLNILLYLHQQQPSIIHRDIKPSNILIADRSGNSVGQVYLIDFGAVKNVAAAKGGTITVVGTYGYMPPEQFGGYTTPVSDLYSLGATLIYLATGRHPTELPSQDGKIIFAESVQLSYSLMRWLEQMVEPSCDKRLKSAAEALQALKSPLAEMSVEIVEQPKYSKILLHKTVEEIEVLIPASGFTAQLPFLIFFTLFWNGFLVVWTGGASLAPFPIDLVFALFSIPFWIVGLYLIGGILFTLWGKTKLKITSQQISLTYECFGIKYQKPKAARRRDITAIELTGTQWRIDEDGDKIPISSAVVVWADGNAYSITSVKNKNTNSQRASIYDPEIIELNWLAQELSQWLDLPLMKKQGKLS
ncbi:MAG: serine/threonine-protein kinase [Cyanobacteria bacterium J06631_2]